MKRKTVESLDIASKQSKGSEVETKPPMPPKNNSLWHILMSDSKLSYSRSNRASNEMHDFSAACPSHDVKILTSDGAILWYDADALRLNTSVVLAAAFASSEGETSHEIKLEAAATTVQDYLNVITRAPATRTEWLDAQFRRLEDVEDLETRLCELAMFAFRYNDTQIMNICSELCIRLFTDLKIVHPSARIVTVCKQLNCFEKYIAEWWILNRIVRSVGPVPSEFANPCLEYAANTACRNIETHKTSQFDTLTDSSIISRVIPYATHLDDRVVGACAMLISVRYIDEIFASNHVGAFQMPRLRTDSKTQYEWCDKTPIGLRIAAARLFIITNELDFMNPKHVEKFNNKYNLWSNLSWLKW